MDLLTLQYHPDVTAAKTAEIAKAAMGGSHYLRSANFTVISPSDLSTLFDLYDRCFFDGHCRRLVNARAAGRLSFRLATRMTNAGGKTFSLRPRRGGSGTASYEIAISTRLLFLNFAEEQRGALVCGLPCNDRLTALQRIMEHEMLHLLEMLLWDRSSCKAARFRGVAKNVFGHAASTHELLTPAGQALAKFDVRLGDRVGFEFNGREMQGVVNRVNRRATVLVESPTGRRYTNGRRYEKFYIPLGMLRKC